jgi:hypothetical protein
MRNVPFCVSRVETEPDIPHSHRPGLLKNVPFCVSGQGVRALAWTMGS